MDKTRKVLCLVHKVNTH